MAPIARELLAEAAASGEDLETVARGLLMRLAELTGLSSTYLAETRLDEDEQRILFSYNSSDVFHIPEDISLPWSEGVCRFVSEGATQLHGRRPEDLPTQQRREVARHPHVRLVPGVHVRGPVVRDPVRREQGPGAGRG